MDKNKEARVAIFISDKIDFKKGDIKRYLEGHFIILKGTIHQEDINIVNIFAPTWNTQINKENLAGLLERC